MDRCATCNQPHGTYVRTMPDGSSHVYADAATLARRNALTEQFKAQVRQGVQAAHDEHDATHVWQRALA